MAVFVVSDPVSSNQPTKYVITMDGGAAFEVDPQPVTGGVRLHYDVTGVSNGTHNMTVSAKNMWGQSTAVPFSFAKAVPTAPSNIALSVE